MDDKIRNMARLITAGISTDDINHWLRVLVSEARNEAFDKAAQSVLALANRNESWHQEAYYAHKRAVAMSIDAIRELKS